MPPFYSSCYNKLFVSLFSLQQYLTTSATHQDPTMLAAVRAQSKSKSLSQCLYTWGRIANACCQVASCKADIHSEQCLERGIGFHLIWPAFRCEVGTWITAHLHHGFRLHWETEEEAQTSGMAWQIVTTLQDRASIVKTRYCTGCLKGTFCLFLSYPEVLGIS